MASVEYWEPAREQATKGRYRFLLMLLPWLGIAGMASILALMPPSGLEPAVVYFGAFLSWVLFFLMVKDCYKSYQRYYQAHVLPDLVSAQAPLRIDPLGGVSMFVLEPSGLFPGAEKVKTHTYLRGVIDGHQVELSALDLTKQKMIRKVRKVQRPVFSGAVFCFDLGAPVVPGTIHVYGSRARRKYAHRRLARGLFRQPLPGTGFGVRVWGAYGTRKVWTPAAREALRDVMKLVPHARISIFDGRHVVVAVPHFHKFFKPAGFFLTPRRDPHMGRVLEVFRSIVRLGVVLGAQPERVYTRSGVCVVGESPSYVPTRSVTLEKETNDGVLPSQEGKGQTWARVSGVMSNGFNRSMYRLGVYWSRSASLRSRAGALVGKATKEGARTARELGHMAAHTNLGERTLEKFDGFKKKKQPENEKDDADIAAMRRFANRSDSSDK